MVKKDGGSPSPGPGPDSNSYSGGATPSIYSWDGGLIFADPGAIRRSSVHVRGAGGNFERVAAVNQHLESYEPLTKSDGDEYWNKFKPGYQQGTKAFLAGVSAFGAALTGLADNMLSIAKAYDKTEENNSEQARALQKALGPTSDDNSPRTRLALGTELQPAEKALARTVAEPALRKALTPRRQALVALEPMVKVVDRPGASATATVKPGTAPKVASASRIPATPLTPAVSSDVQPAQPLSGTLTSRIPASPASPLSTEAPLTTSSAVQPGLPLGGTVSSRIPASPAMSPIGSGDPGVTIPQVPQVVTGTDGQPVGILAPAGTPLEDNGQRTIFTGPDGVEKGFFQPFDGHSLADVAPGQIRPAPDTAVIDSDFDIPDMPRVVTNAEGEEIGILAPAGALFEDNGRRTILVDANGVEQGYFQPFGDHTFAEVQNAPGILDGLAPAAPPTALVFVDPDGNPVNPDFAIPEMPKVLTNAEGEEIGIIAPPGTMLEDNGKRTVFLSADGSEAGFFQAFGGHAFDEVDRSQLLPPAQPTAVVFVDPVGSPLDPDVVIPEVPRIVTDSNGKEIGLLASPDTLFQETANRQTLVDTDGREIGFFQPFGEHTFADVDLRGAGGSALPQPAMA